MKSLNERDSINHFLILQTILKKNINKLAYEDLNKTAESAVLRLNVASEVIFPAGWLVQNSIRSEAIYSNAIASNKIELLNLLHQEIQPEINIDNHVKQVIDSIAAYHFVNDKLANFSGQVFNTTLLQEAHVKILAKDLGLKLNNKSNQAREYFWSNNFLPPLINDVPKLLSVMDEIIQNKPTYFSPLAYIAIICGYFKIINPFNSGNRRIGRLLIPALLKDWNIAPSFTLQMSKYFYDNRFEYDNLLRSIYHKNNWNDWITFFLNGVIYSANFTEKIIIQISNLIEIDRHELMRNNASTATTYQLFNLLPMMPYFNSNQICQKLNITPPSANRAINLLISFGILKETSNKQRNRYFSYQKYIDLLA